MSDNESKGSDVMLAVILLLVWTIVGIVAAIIIGIIEFGKFIAEGALVTFPVLGVAAWITYKVETAYRSSQREPPERALDLLQEAQAWGKTIALVSGGIAVFCLLILFGANSSAGRLAAAGWLFISGAACVTYLFVLARHRGREKELKAAQEREKNLEIRRLQEEEAQERERRRCRLAQRLGDIDLFLEDHYFEGALLALAELEEEYWEEGMTISQVRRRVKDAEFAYHKARAEPHLRRLDGLLAHLDQMKQVRRS